MITRYRNGRSQVPERSRGRTTPISAMRERPKMSESGEVNVGQLVRQAYGAAAVLVGFTTYTVPSRPYQSGTDQRSANGCDRQSPRVMNGCFTRRTCRALCYHCAQTSIWRQRSSVHVWSARLVCCTSRRQSARVTISGRVYPRSSTPCCISTKHVPSSRWIEAPPGTQAMSPKPSVLVSERPPACFQSRGCL